MPIHAMIAPAVPLPLAPVTSPVAAIDRREPGT